VDCHAQRIARKRAGQEPREIRRRQDLGRRRGGPCRARARPLDLA